MSANTVRKYISELEAHGLIATEPTSVITKAGEKRNGTLLYTIRPIQEAVDRFHQSQMEQLEVTTQRQRVAPLLGLWRHLEGEVAQLPAESHVEELGAPVGEKSSYWGSE